MEVNAERWKNSIVAQFSSLANKMEGFFDRLDDSDKEEAAILLEKYKEIVDEAELFMDSAVENDK